MASDKIVSGVFAVHKPVSKSSVQVMRDVQHIFRTSRLCQSWFMQEQARRDKMVKLKRGSNKLLKRLDREQMQVKMGHGGTLDPEASGVLILGVGEGTKSLNDFLECTKTYECVVLFGASTDTYDREGRILERKPYEHITREKTLKAMEAFRGNIMQQPPLYSALWHQGKRLYDIAREGGKMPAAIKPRPMRVDECEMLEWYEGGTHDFHWPTREAEDKDEKFKDKDLMEDMAGEEAMKEAERLMEEETEDVFEHKKAGDQNAPPKDDSKNMLKRDREVDVIDGTEKDKDAPSSPKRPRSSTEPAASGALVDPPPDTHDTAQPTIEQPDSTANQNAADKPSASTPCPAPACRIRLTVSSGFYVRSFCYDLGVALDSAAFMAALVRTRQQDFQLGKNVVEMEDLAKGEDVWGPQVEALLDDWNAKKEAIEDANPEPRPKQKKGDKYAKHALKRWEKRQEKRQERRRRNSSSPESSAG